MPAQDEKIELMRALESGEIVPWYQAIVDLGTGRMIGAEALARWVRPSGELVSAETLIRTAESHDLVGCLDLTILRRAVLDLRTWQRGKPQLRLNVNLSGRLTRDAGWGESVEDIVDSLGVRPDSVDLELTESTNPSDLRAFDAAVQKLRGCGFQIWLDDIGAGWQILDQILDLEIDGIKMERAFAELLGTPGEQRISEVASATARRGLGVILEGIETSDQCRRARELGVTLGQGFFWTRPVPETHVMGLFDRFGAGT